jgi:hypothetical protein
MIGSALTVRECVLISRMIDSLRVKYPGAIVKYSVSWIGDVIRHRIYADLSGAGYEAVEVGGTVEELYDSLGRPGDLTKEYEAYENGTLNPFNPDEETFPEWT